MSFQTEVAILFDCRVFVEAGEVRVYCKSLGDFFDVCRTSEIDKSGICDTHAWLEIGTAIVRSPNLKAGEFAMVRKELEGIKARKEESAYVVEAGKMASQM